MTGRVLMACLALSLAGAAAEAPPRIPVEQMPSADAVWRTDLDNPNWLDRDWKFDGGRFMVPKTRFYIADEPTATDGRVMVVEANRSTGVFLTAPTADISKRPILRWRWRLVRPITWEGEAEEPDDQAAVIYFGDGTMLRQKCVGYRWEFNTPVGRSVRKSYAGGMMTVQSLCVRNKKDAVGEWIIEERDVVVDFQNAFQKTPNEYYIVSVGANSQYSKSNTRVEIDYIEFIPRKDKEKKEGR